MSNVIEVQEVFRETKAFNIMSSMEVKDLVNLRARINHGLPMPDYPEDTFKFSDLKILDEIVRTKIRGE